MSEKWTPEQWHTAYEKAVEFLDGRELLSIQVSEVLSHYDKVCDLVRLGLFYEIHRCRVNKAYLRSLEGRNVRNLWYDLIQAFLMKVEPSENRRSAQYKEPWNRLRTKTLSHQLSLMVRRGLVKYSELKIEEDVARPKRRPPDWKKLKTGRFDEVVLFCEKAGQFTRIQCLAELLGITVETGKGQQATSSIEPMVDYLLEHPERNYLVLCIVDYDYGGHRIYEDFIKRIPELGLKVEAYHIGITPDQIPGKVKAVKVWELPTSYKPMREWAKKHGWKGKYGFEIECLTPKQLRGIIADAIYEHCDPQALYDYFMEQALEEVPEKVAEDLASEKMSELHDVILALEEAIDKVPGVEKLQQQMQKFRAEIEKVEAEIDEKPEVEAIQNEINSIEAQRDEEELKEKYQEKAEERLEWDTELDDRKPFPKDWLRRQIVKGSTQLRHKKYTDTGKVEENLKAAVEGDVF